MTKLQEPHLSPRRLARALGVSESSVKRWADSGRLQVQRTRGGHRRIDPAEALRFARELGRPLNEPGLLGLGGREAGAGTASAANEQSTQWLAAGDSENFGSALLQLYVRGNRIPQLIDQQLAPAINEIGSYWTERADGVFIEHRATEICAQIVHRLAALLPDAPGGPVALGGGPSGDPYRLPSLCVATSLRAEGFRVVNLGADVPLQAFEAAIALHEPALIWLSVSSAAGLAGTERLLEQLSELARRHGAALIVGGRSSARLRNLRRLRVDTGSNMVELAGFARGVVAGARHRVNFIKN